MKFPKEFLWGSDIAASQCEGGWNLDGKTPITSDYGTVGSQSGMRMKTYVDDNGNQGLYPFFATYPLEYFNACASIFFLDQYIAFRKPFVYSNIA